MVNSCISPERIRKKKFLILICGVVIFFLTSMAKVLIPATIFKDLQQMGMDVDRISALGAAFLYSYAASQLVMGCFSDRYGGVRILLIGGTLFSAGTILFPLMNLEHYFLAILIRLITGFGAGTIFLGVAKLLGDLYPGKFGLSLGYVLIISYFGPTVGTVPMVKLVEFSGWQFAMILPGLVAAAALITIILLMRGTIKPVMPGQTLEPLFDVLKHRKMWFLCFSCATVYGAYYTLVGQIGTKIMSDVFSVKSDNAALFMMILTIIVALNNIGGNLLLKLFKGKRKTVLITGIFSSLIGIALANFVFYSKGNLFLYLISGILIAFPAGFFPMFSLVAKELNKPERMGMAVAFLNFMAFVFISLYQNITGWILNRYQPDAVTLAFPLRAYSEVFLFFLIGAIISRIAVCFVPETGKEDL